MATFCGKCDCGCPELFVDRTAEPLKQIVITGDFGQRIQMSHDQLADLVEQARSGAGTGGCPRASGRPPSLRGPG